MSRRSIEEAECVELDLHLRQHRLGEPAVALAWEHRAEYEINAPQVRAASLSDWNSGAVKWWGANV